MPSFLPCIGHTCRRRSRQVLNTSTSAPSAKRDSQSTTKYSSSEVGDETSSGGGSGPAPLPVITDRGPPTAQNYEDPDIYWNSIMIEADEDEKARLMAGPRRRGHMEANRSGLPDSVENSAHTGFNHISESPQINGVNSSSTGSDAEYRRRHDADHTHTHEHPGIVQADHDLTVMSASVPNYANPPVRQVQLRRPPRLIPGTRAWDDFWDPLEYTPRSRLPNPRHHHVIPEESKNVPQSTSVPQEEKDLPDLPIERRSLTPPTNQAFRKTPPLTWNTSLNEILDHDNVDQNMADRVRERVRSSTTVNGDGKDEHFHVSTIEAGLVPNFSYPVAGSPFYDRAYSTQSPPSALTNALVNGAVYSDAGMSSEGDKHTSTATNLSDRPLDFNFEFLSSGTPSTPSSPLRSPTSSTSDSLYRAPTPLSTSITRLRLNSLLSEILTPSEVDLCNTILRPPLNSPPRLDPINTRLVLSLHRALLHLQDRISHLEDSLLPQLGTSLEKKTYTIDVLSAEIRKLDDQIRELKLTVDFGNKVLAGCWIREYEVWRTLVGIREGRRRREWWKLWQTNKSHIEDGVLSPDDERRERGRDGKGWKLKNGELEALIEMTKQNVDILREDVDDMVEKVERFRVERERPSSPQPEPGIWRDV